MPASAPPLSADLTEALKRLKLATVRRMAPDVLATAKVQRWAPEEVLRTLIEAEVSARDASKGCHSSSSHQCPSWHRASSARRAKPNTTRSRARMYLGGSRRQRVA